MTSANYKAQYQGDDGLWSNVCDSSGSVEIFANEDAAHAELATRFPVLAHPESYGGEKRTRVVRVFRTDEEWQEGTPPDND